MIRTSNPIIFGLRLLDTNDLDPVYVMLHHSGLSESQKARFCVAYWLFYHAGVSSILSEMDGALFWKACYGMQPRGTERRHFRGDKAKAAIGAISARFPRPVDLIHSITSPNLEAESGLGMIAGVGSEGTGGANPARAPIAFSTIFHRAQELPLFGPWIAFKMADMLERVLGYPVDFSDCDLLGFYKEPRLGAMLAASRWNTTAEGALNLLTSTLRKRTAPPAHDRPCNIQEAETVLCKWKASLKGHYYIGKDTIEVRHALNVPCKTAERLSKALLANTPKRSLI